MKKKIVANLVILLLISGLFQITLQITPAVVSGQSEAYKEVWKVVNVTNTYNWTTMGDIKIAVSPNDGVNIACSTNITKYFENVTHWKSLGYNTYMEWLNGTSARPYHWGEMDWYVSQGSLTSIGWDEIKCWWDMYKDSGGGVSYETFMGNTYMADCNSTDPTNNPDIIGTVPWIGGNITIKDLVVAGNTTMYLVFKIVLTEPGGYNFNLTSSNLWLEILPSSWRVGGVATVLVPDDYSKIQAAIHAASPGDTVFVAAGTYNERLVIDKQLTLTGSDTTTIIQPTDAPTAGVYDVEIDASGTIIQNFLFDFNGADDTRGGTGIVVGDMNEPPVMNVQILNNTIYTGDGSGVGGTGVQTGKNCDVSGLLIQGNTFYGDATGMGEGVYVNPYTGTGGVTIYYNEFYGYLYSGVSIEASNVNASNNVINSNATKGIYGVRFIDLNSTESITFPNTYTGVQISNNNIQNVEKGIRVGTSTDVGSSLTATIQSNTITNNDIGIWVRYGAYLTDSIHYNNIADNTDYGINNAAGERSVNATYNWWGHETGPEPAIAYYIYPENETSGLGDDVTGFVDFEPWLIQPYPPAVPISQLYVEPKSVKCWTSLNKTFEVKVELANAKLLYGFEFKLGWNAALLNVTTAIYSPLWGTYYLWQDTINNTAGEYYLAVTGKGDVAAFNGSATLATLTFKIVKEPTYPNHVTSDLAFVKTQLSCSKNLTDQERILHLMYDGVYICNYTLPKIMLGQPEYVVEWVPKDFEVEVKVTSVFNLTAFNFTLTYDQTLLKLLFAESRILLGTSGEISWDTDRVFGRANGISPPVNGTVTLAIIKFRALGVVWSTVNRSVSCALEFNDTNLIGLGNDLILHERINGTYRYKPLPGDLNMDGEVELTDLVLAASAFGIEYEPGVPPTYLPEDFNHDGTVDILDVIVVARNYGRHA